MIHLQSTDRSLRFALTKILTVRYPRSYQRPITHLLKLHIYIFFSIKQLVIRKTSRARLYWKTSRKNFTRKITKHFQFYLDIRSTHAFVITHLYSHR